VEEAVVQFDSSDAEVSVYVKRETESLLSRLGHDIKIAVRSFSIDVDPESGTVEATFDPTSLEPVDAIKWESREPTEEMSDGDRHEIKQRIDDEVLDPDAHPRIRFEASGIELGDDGAWSGQGTLSLHGQSNPIDVECSVKAGYLHAEAVFDHTDFGIEQYSAMLGSLKVDPEVVVTVEVPWEV
jgi:hypothetical protein